MVRYLLVAMLLAVGCASEPTIDPKEKKAELYYNQGTAELYNKNFTDALKYLLQANELRPNHSKTLNNLGMAYYFKKQTDLAITHLQKAIEADPKNSDAKMNIATIYNNQGKYDKALSLYHEILKDLLYDKQAMTHYNIGLIHLKRNEAQLAKDQFLKSIEAFDSYCPSHFQLGKLAFQDKQFQDAYNHFHKAGSGTCSNLPEPIYMQGLSLIQLERYSDATMKFETIQSRFDNTKYAPLAKRKMMSIAHLLEDDIHSQFTLKSKIKKKLENVDF